MKKFILDSDALIKLTRSGIIELFCSYYSCIITKQVYDEVVSEGKKRHYENASIIEDLVIRKNITTIAVTQIKQDLPLGLGELSSLQLYRKITADAIISDDRKFIILLENEEIPFLFPVDVILLLRFENIMTKEESLGVLEIMKRFVRLEQYARAKEMLKGD
ncbi:hypothetical protein HZA96_01100 [Candidatus Woesearchaeota archaeon]|nr:hypothetical protein [Candidatus Woesearchaeota archaeon]